MTSFRQASSVFFLRALIGAYAVELPEEAVLRADGKIIEVGGQRRSSVMRRHKEHSPHELDDLPVFSELGQSERDRAEIDKFFKSMANPSFTEKSRSASGAASRTNASAGRKKSMAGHRLKGDGDDLLWDEIQKGGLKMHPPPSFKWPEEWHGNKMELLQDNCDVIVGEDQGYSDYGTLPHSCAQCAHKCTHANRQQEIKTLWNMDPALPDEPAKAFHFYTVMESIDGLGCTNCMDWKDKGEEEIGVSTNYEIDFSATKETKDIPNFKALLGSYVSTGTGTEFAGKLFFMVRDTVRPKNIDNCKANPPGRRYALQGASRYGELFYCQRFCTIPHEDGGCPCGFMDAVGCMVHVHMATGMMVKFNLRVVADDAMAPLTGDDGKPKSLGGQQWEAVATFGQDNSDSKIEAVIGRVVLTGNGEDEGVVGMKHNLHHKGCTPCDMFYSSFVQVGPFITAPAGVHWIRNAEIDPPPLTEESCQLFRVTAKRGHVLLFESGPGIWPVTQAGVTQLFTCPRPEGNHTR